MEAEKSRNCCLFFPYFFVCCLFHGVSKATRHLALTILTRTPSRLPLLCSLFHNLWLFIAAHLLMSLLKKKKRPKAKVAEEKMQFLAHFLWVLLPRRNEDEPKRAVLKHFISKLQVVSSAHN